MKNIILACIAITFFACKTSTISNKEVIAPKNVILLISDGTGLSQISSAFYFKDSLPNYARFKDIGLIKTSSSREDVTDSAAGATAFACGVKTYNGAIGVADDSTEVKNLDRNRLLSPILIRNSNLFDSDRYWLMFSWLCSFDDCGAMQDRD